MNLRLLPILLCIIVSSATSNHAAVVSQALGITQFDPPQSGPLGADAEVHPNVPGWGGWSQFLALQSDGHLKFVAGTVGTVFAWFTISQGERLDAAFVLGNPWHPRGPHSILYGDVFAPEPDGTWLFGCWTGGRSFDYDPGPDDCYGWLRMGVSAGKLTIMDDAAEVGGAGIYAGTLIAVPEPGLIAILAGALGLLTARRSRECRRRGLEPG